MLGLSTRIGTLPVARSVTHGTSSRFMDHDTVPCCAMGFMLASQRHMRTVDFKLMLCVKITSCAVCRQEGNNFLFVIDLPARHHSAVSKNLWRRGSSLHKGNLGEGKGGEGEEGVGCSNKMITKNINKIVSPHRISRYQCRVSFWQTTTVSSFFSAWWIRIILSFLLCIYSLHCCP